ncbi:hypothetical protein I601_2605 [Nocardioides dokdonensis FR1436]|uniref:DUF4439 domain-containing protein n=1 Tax=Nocardioides dokdonensis FR1436 TaxID=1300347 RepID=A0A1A9GNG4_9ACTN|nr:DUF4439 domain-containing protein [Nocardioides dokdonensis]ANH39021.1 hypothetical protein I601_2605 [Nocardioides dokdonensis FR1436]
MRTLEALQATLLAEHAAVHVYGVLGAATSMSATPELYERISQGWTAHRGRRDALEVELRDAGEEPVGTAAFYEVPGPVRTPEQVSATAALVERRCAASYAALVAATAGSRRRTAVQLLGEAAVTVLAFGGPAEALPGLDPEG